MREPSRCLRNSLLSSAANGGRQVNLGPNSSNTLLHEAIEAMPHGVVLLDNDGRYTLWNSKYAEIYHKSADLFAPGVKLADTLRCGVERGDYPEAIGNEDE